MSFEVKATKNDQKPTRIYLALEVMQQRQIGTGDLITVRKQDQVNRLLLIDFCCRLTLLCYY